MFAHASRFLKCIFVGLALIAIVGCMPRGETRTLDEVLQDAKQRFAVADRSKMPADLVASFEKLSSRLQELASANENYNYEASAQDVSDILVNLAPRAGYTTRPGLGELADQYRFFRNDGSATATKAKAKLLVSRTFSLLAGELETTKFAL